MEKICEFSPYRDVYGDLIFESRYWMVFLAPSQRYLGTCVVSLKRECKDLRELNTEEWIEFSKINKAMELAIVKTFKPDLFNWSCFKNASFRKDKPNPHIHWHVLPRYKEIAIFEDLEFEDPDFGYIPQAIAKLIPDSMRFKLIKAIKDNLNIKVVNDKCFFD